MASAIATFAKNNCMHPQNSSCRDEKGLVVQPFLAKKRLKVWLEFFFVAYSIESIYIDKKNYTNVVGQAYSGHLIIRLQDLFEFQASVSS